MHLRHMLDDGQPQARTAGLAGIHFFTLDEQKRFINALPDDTSGRALYFVLGTGIRLAELSGLRWCDIHGEYFTIIQTIRRNRNFDEDDPRRTSLQVRPLKQKQDAEPFPSHRS